MKKSVIAVSLLAALVTTVGFAGKQFLLNSKASFEQQLWTSFNTQDVVTIESGSPHGDFSVQIYVYAPTGDKAGVNIIQGCDSVKHIAPNSSAVCTLNEWNRTIRFSSDSDKIGTSGSYQVQS